MIRKRQKQKQIVVNKEVKDVAAVAHKRYYPVKGTQAMNAWVKENSEILIMLVLDTNK